MLKVCLLTLVLGISIAAHGEIQKPCPSRPGSSYPTEGSGVCRGNHSLAIPLNTTGLSLVYNSQSKVNLGYGVGWSVSADQYFEIYANGKGALFLGDGSQIDFTYDGSKWAANYPALYPEKIAAVSSFVLKESHVDGSYLQFYKLGSSNRYAITAKVSRKGTEQSFARANTVGALSRVTNFFNQSVNLSYVNGKLSSVSDYKGSKYLIDQDVNNNLLKVTYPDGSTAEFTYQEGTNLMSSYKTRQNRTASFSYYVSGSDSALKSVTDTEELVTEIIYAPSAVEVKGFANNSKETFSSVGNLKVIESVSNGVKSSLKFDEKMRLIQAKNHLEEVTSYAYNGDTPYVQSVSKADGTSVSYVYNPSNKVIRKTIAGGTKSITTNYTRDQFGQVTEVKTGSLSSKYSYDTKGNVTKAVDPAGKVAYSATYFSNSLPASVTDIKGNSSSYSYDPIGNRTQAIYPTGEKVDAQYDALGLPVQKSRVDQNSSSISNYQYDSLGRPVVVSKEVQSASGNLKSISSSQYSVTTESEHTTAYQLNGLAVKEYKQKVDSKGRSIEEQESIAE